MEEQGREIVSKGRGHEPRRESETEADRGGTYERIEQESGSSTAARCKIL
jgi:hypothetical protein